MRTYKKGYGQICIVQLYDEDGSWSIAVESETKGTLFEVKSDG